MLYPLVWAQAHQEPHYGEAGMPEPYQLFPVEAFQTQTIGKDVPQGLKPSLAPPLTARLQSCPDTGHSSRESGKTSADLNLSPDPGLTCLKMRFSHTL